MLYLPSKTLNVSVSNPRSSPLMTIENEILCSPVLNVVVLMTYGEEPTKIDNN